MYQVKIFSGKIKAVEANMQQFLNENPNIEIVNFRQDASVGFIVITLIYRINK